MIYCVIRLRYFTIILILPYEHPTQTRRCKNNGQNKNVFLQRVRGWVGCPLF